MNEFPDQEQPTSDTLDFSDDEALQPQPYAQPSHHGSVFSTVGSSDMAQIANIDRNAYSDEDIKIVYEIVVRAETILAEELTPSSRLPTHALFLAYDEILAEHGLDAGERHISKLVFMIGGVKGHKSIMDRFKAVMARMNITLAIEEPQVSESEREYHEGYHVGSDAEDVHTIDDEYTHSVYMNHAQSNDHRLDSDYTLNLPAEAPDVVDEKHLADKAEAFRRKHHAQFLAVATLRRWHNTSHYVSYLSAQSDVTRSTELREALEDKFHTWRALAAETALAEPENVHPNAYSKRTERIATRAHDILSTNKALIKWRQSNQEEYRRSRDAELLAHQLARQECDDDDFKDNPALARLAQRTHRNLVLSKAFTKWANRVEEEDAKAEVAAKAYEINLKLKALGVARKHSAMDGMRKLLASKTGGVGDSPANQAVAPETRQPEPLDAATTKSTSTVSNPPRPRPPLERPLSSIDIATRLQTRSHAENRHASSTVRPLTAIPIRTVPPTIPPIGGVSAGATPASPVVPIPTDKPNPDTDISDDDQPDERTMLARRHILRMRYFGAWERYTSENIEKVEQFGQESQDQRVARSVLRWRDEAASRRQQAAERNIDFQETRAYRRVADTVPRWREKASREIHCRENVLEYYAKRAEYYQKTTKALPVFRGKTEQAEQREKLLRSYAERTNYFLRTTQALSIWRERARDASQKHELQEHYGQRADYYYRTRGILSTWQHRTKQRRKERLKEAHLETRRMVKKNMGERCIKQWRDRLEPSYQRYEIMNVALVDALEDREWKQASQAFNTWRYRAQELTEAAATGDVMLKQKAIGEWRGKATLHEDLEMEAEEHWEIKAKSRALKNWNLGSLQGANRPQMVASALEKKERRLLRQGFETWYGRTADKLVPVELPNGAYRNVGQVVEGAQHQTIQHQARGLLHTWKAAAAATAAANTRASQVQDEEYAPTPGRPRLFGIYGGRETTTPLAPVPSYTRWQARDSAMGRSEFGARAGRSERTKPPKNLRVSWAA
ncbi:hypothetical protein F5Y09DRAFT_326519 [Xylaria sp. FL1042]|nr:hypothetical protein F5Y09DRAFT_326519 [Xylaria sp. FL1042]